MNKRFGVVGGSCADIFATSALPLVTHDSNPGTVHIGYGGVGRNIAENLSRLEQSVHLIAAFGSDPFSAEMLKHTTAAGVNTDGCLLSSTYKAPYYISVNEPSGELSVAVNDMEICDLVTPEFLSSRLSVLNQCDAIILDANIPKHSIDFLAAHCAPPLFADSVSTHKAVKLYDALPRLFALNTNLQEAQSLLSIEITDDIQSLKHAANCFHGKGIAFVLITLGARGAFFSDGHSQLIAEAYQVKTVNLNGCGDAFSAAAFLGILLHDSPQYILKNALAAAAITALSAQSVSQALSPDSIRALLQKKRTPQ